MLLFLDFDLDPNLFAAALDDNHGRPGRLVAGYVRVGEKYDYKLKVTNLSKTVTLENVKVTQSASSKLDIMASGQPAAGEVAGTNGEDDTDLTWNVMSLKPGGSKTLSAPAVAYEEGSSAAASARVTTPRCACASRPSSRASR